jgi:hypothetical protein
LIDHEEKTKKREEEKGKKENDLRLFSHPTHRRSLKYLIILFLQSTTVTSVV